MRAGQPTKHFLPVIAKLFSPPAQRSAHLFRAFPVQYADSGWGGGGKLTFFTSFSISILASGSAKFARSRREKRKSDNSNN